MYNTSSLQYDTMFNAVFYNPKLMYHIQSCSLFYWNVVVVFRRLLKIAKRDC